MGALIAFLLVFTPWAFGSTESWSMRIANAAAWSLGLLVLANWLLHRPTVRPPHRPTAPPPPIILLAVLTVALLGYVLISALNSRAACDEQTNTFTYKECIAWLPHSYDSNCTWPAFWNYVAFAAFFWSVRDWLTRAAPEQQGNAGGVAAVGRSEAGGRGTGAALNPRLRWVLWVLSINGGLLALEALIQQTTGTNKLLWIRDTFYNRQAEAQLGPFAYRANGAQYLNLIWPVTLGFWWSLQRRRALDRSAHHVLLACVVIMMVAPLISLSRGGALITVGTALLSAGVLLFGSLRQRTLIQTLVIMAVLLAGVAGGLFVNWPKLEKRMEEIREASALRERICVIGRKMAAEHPVFGTGAETVQPLYQFYKGAADEYWPGQLHNDWLETRVTFGWVGFCMILCALAAVLVHWFVASQHTAVSWRFVSFIWIALAGCLVHARWDLPFQVYSIVLLFLFYCAVLSGLRRRS